MILRLASCCERERQTGARIPSVIFCLPFEIKFQFVGEVSRKDFDFLESSGTSEVNLKPDILRVSCF